MALSSSNSGILTMMHKVSVPSLWLLVGSAAALLLAAGGAEAQATTMPLGRSSPAPSGFLEFCSRTPEDCLQPGLQAAEVRTQARALYWAGVFNRPADRPASTGTVSTVSNPESVRGRAVAGPMRYSGPWGRSSYQSIPQRRTIDLADRVPAGTPPFPTGTRIALPMTAKDWDATDQLNREINRRIRRASDQRQHGVGDYWSVPTGTAPRGDCEDYVLAKRRAMIDLGYPQAAFSIALVETSWGESHAVLLMMTSEGEFVLDNLTPKIVRWDQADYKWMKRQIPGHTLEWAVVG